jgi:hypothetical protein
MFKAFLKWQMVIKFKEHMIRILSKIIDVMNIYNMPKEN